MNSIDLKLIRKLFSELIEVPPEKREKFLDEKCGGDIKFRNELISLLKNFEGSEDFLEYNSGTSVNTFLSEKNNIEGKHIGPYLILEETGAGGMGIVYSAKRDDQTFDQKVAIKILKYGISEQYLLKRFLRERQTLANLHHPNIAQLFDGGKTDDDLPYLVMEFIDGIPITDYCDLHKLNIKKRLQLFRIVCSAVQYAHQNLVIHRDIKPGNILVTKEGVPKLLDFGIAKLLDEDLGNDENNLTKAGIFHLTPDYASPEQISGERISTASDIYSLGILLYRLLSGYQPYKFSTNSIVVINNQFDQLKIINPSEMVIKNRAEKSDKVNQILSGDLDNIVIKAINRNPERRYVSVEQFSEDIRRYLSGLPVIARKDTISYRFSRFAKRHKAGFILGTIFILFLITGVILISWQSSIASKEKDRALLEVEKSERVNLFLRDMLSSVDPRGDGKNVKVYDILEKTSRNISTELKDQPQIEAEIRQTIGNTYTSLGEYDKAIVQLKKALTLDQKIFGEESKEFASGLHDLGLYYHWTGEYKLADSLYKKSLTLLNAQPDSYSHAKAITLNDYGLLKNDLGFYNEAEKMFNESLEITEKNYGTHNREVASTTNNLAITLHYLNKVDDAEKYYLKAQNLFKELFGENNLEVASTFNNLGFIYIDKGNYEKAEDYFSKSYLIKHELEGENHPDVGLAYHNLGLILFKRENYKGAYKYFKKSISNFKRTLQDDHNWMGNSLYMLGRTQLKLELIKASEESLFKALKIRNKNLPPNHYLIYLTKGYLGISLLKQSKYSNAKKLLEEGYNGCLNKIEVKPDDINEFQSALKSISRIQMDSTNL